MGVLQPLAKLVIWIQPAGPIVKVYSSICKGAIKQLDGWIQFLIFLTDYHVYHYEFSFHFIFLLSLFNLSLLSPLSLYWTDWGFFVFDKIENFLLVANFVVILRLSLSSLEYVLFRDVFEESIPSVSTNFALSRTISSFHMLTKKSSKLAKMAHFFGLNWTKCTWAWGSKKSRQVALVLWSPAKTIIWSQWTSWSQ